MDSNRPFHIGDWRVDPALDEIRCGDRGVKLEPRMMRLLCCLAERPGEVVSVDTLLDRVWTGVVVGQSSVYQAVAHLRRVLGDTEAESRYIATVPRKGYRLVAAVRSEAAAPPVSGVGAATPDASVAAVPAIVESAPPGPIAGRGGRGRQFVYLFAAVVALAVLIGAGVSLSRRTPTAATEPPAIAVLPFADLSPDASDGAFCDGLTDELLNALARVPALRVIGRTSSSRFRDGSADVREIGGKLGVSHVLEGSVRRTGGMLRVSARLVSTGDGFQVWSNSFDRPASDALAIQMQIARAVVDALQVQLSPAAEQRLARGPTSQVNAYDLYLLGRHQQQQRNPEALARAVGFHQAAIAADPKFALAHAGLADAYMAGYYYANRSLEETARLVQPEVDAALRLDPQLAEGYAAWAVLLTEQWRTEEAINALKRAIAINSNYGDAYVRLGAAYEYDGQPRQALTAYDQAAVLDPLNTPLHVRRCLTLQNLGRYAEAERACVRGFELQPDVPNALWARGLNAVAQGDLVAAVGHYRAALLRGPKRADIRAELATLYLDLGLPEMATKEFAVLRAGGLGTEQALAYGRMFLATGDKAGLQRFLTGISLAEAAPRERVDAAFLALAAGDAALAGRLGGAALAPRATEADDFAPGLYRTRWGVCELCSLALLERQRGDTAAAERHATAAAQYLDAVESHGHVWHGLHYLRATLQAQRGEADAALQSLQRAVDLGWRRAWLMRADPALQSLAGHPRFLNLLASLDATNAEARERLGGTAAEPAAPGR